MASDINRLTRAEEFGSKCGPRDTARGQPIGRTRESNEIYEPSRKISWRICAAKTTGPIAPIHWIDRIIISFAQLQCWFRRCSSKLRTGVGQAERCGETRSYAFDSFRGRAIASVSASGRCILQKVWRQSRSLYR